MEKKMESDKSKHPVGYPPPYGSPLGQQYLPPPGPQYGPPPGPQYGFSPEPNYGAPTGPHYGPPPGPHYGPPPRPQYGASGGTVTTVTVVPVTTATYVTTSAYPRMGSQPQSAICRRCNTEVVTKIKYTTSMKTHLCAALLCVLVLWPCVCIPYCMNNLKKVDHYCPNCKSFLGSYKP